jgi:hypothetical protein
MSFPVVPCPETGQDAELFSGREYSARMPQGD